MPGINTQVEEYVHERPSDEEVERCKAYIAAQKVAGVILMYAGTEGDADRPALVTIPKGLRADLPA